MADQVSVSNELGTSAAERGEPFTTRLLPLDRDDDPVVFPYSPRGHERGASPSWSERGAVGADTDQLDWENSAPDELSTSVQLQADRGSFATFTPADLLDLLRTLEQWATQPTERTGRPTRVVLEQGAGSISGVLRDVSSSVTEKTPEGLPRTAELSLTVAEQ